MSKIVVKVAVNDNDFVGLKIKNDNINITFPIGYDIEEGVYSSDDFYELKDVSENFESLMRVLEKVPLDYYDEGEIKFNFSSALNIIDNYRIHGLYKEQNEIIKQDNNGKINWKETINSGKPILWNHTIVYPELYIYNSNDTSTIITKIQKFCINYIFKIFWWMYGNTRIILFPEIPNMRIDYMIFELNKKIVEVNDDYSKNVINEMILFLNGTKIVDISENEEIKIGRKYFDKIWERQLRIQLYSEYKKCADAYPTTYYCFDGKNKIVNNSLLPDIVFYVQDYLIIVDAKYYMIGNYPKSSDICKQLFYERYLRKKNKKIINMFVLPGNIKEKFKIKGYALADGFDEESKIELCYLDTKSVFRDKSTTKELINNILKKHIGTNCDQQIDKKKM